MRERVARGGGGGGRKGKKKVIIRVIRGDKDNFFLNIKNIDE